MLPVHSQNARTNAGIVGSSAALFSMGARRVRGMAKARASDTNRTFLCENQYPSPSMWSGLRLQVRPRFSIEFERCLAERRHLAGSTLAPKAFPSIYASRGCGTGPEGGNKSCRRYSVLRRFQRYSRSRLAATPTLNAASRAQQSAPLAQNLSVGTSSPVQPSAEPRVSFVTMSRRSFASSNSHYEFKFQQPSKPGAWAAVVVPAKARA